MKQMTLILSFGLIIALCSCDKEQLIENDASSFKIESNDNSVANRQGQTEESNATFITMIETENGFEIVDGQYGNLEVTSSYTETPQTAHFLLQNDLSIENTANRRYFISVDDGILETLSKESMGTYHRSGILDVVFEGTQGRQHQGILEVVMEDSMDRQGILEVVLEVGMGRHGILEVFIDGTMGRSGILEVVLESNVD